MTIDEIISRKEDQTFDCKSIQVDPKALAVPIVAMANADGGVLAIGVSDKTHRGREPTYAAVERAASGADGLLYALRQGSLRLSALCGQRG